MSITRLAASSSLSNSIQTGARGFSTSASRSETKQFMVIFRDYTDAEALNRRLSVRQTHLVGAQGMKKSQELLLGGAIMTDHSESAKMIGSVMLFNMESKEDVVKAIERDPYFTGKVWENYEILPFRQAKIDA